MKFYTTVLIFSFIFFTHTYAQSFGWLNTFGSANGLESALTMDVKGSEILVGGRFENTVNFSSVTQPFNLTSNGFSDGFVATYDTLGNFHWALKIGSTLNDRITVVKYAKDGSIFVSGVFFGTCDFDPGPNSYLLTAQGGWEDAFLLKLDQSGNFIWARTFGGANSDYIADIDFDFVGNVFVFGNYKLTMDFDPGMNTVSYTAMDIPSTTKNGDLFIIKLDTSGNYINGVSIGGKGSEYASSLVIRDNVLFITGGFQDSVDFDQDSIMFEILLGALANGTADMFIASYDIQNLNLLWADNYGDQNSLTIGSSVNIDAGNDLVLTGTYSSNFDWDHSLNSLFLNPTVTSLNNIFILKLSGTGQFLWVKSFDTVNGFGYNSATTILDSANDIFLTGSFDGITDFDPDINSTSIETPQNVGKEAIFIVKLSTNGDFRWSGSIKSNDYCLGQAVFVQTSDVYVCGNFSFTADFDIGLPVYNATSSGGFGDGYLLKLDNYVLQSLSEGSAFDFFVSPNPSSDWVFIAWNNTILVSSLFLYNSLGQCVYTASGLSSLASVKINLEELPSGLYYMRLSSGEKYLTCSILKQ